MAWTNHYSMWLEDVCTCVLNCVPWTSPCQTKPVKGGMTNSRLLFAEEESFSSHASRDDTAQFMAALTRLLPSKFRCMKKHACCLAYI